MIRLVPRVQTQRQWAAHRETGKCYADSESWRALFRARIRSRLRARFARQLGAIQENGVKKPRVIGIVLSERQLSRAQCQVQQGG